MKHSLEVYADQSLVFYSDGKWLHPLFELEARLPSLNVEPQRLQLRDTIIGRAAAMLIIRMGFRNVHGKIMSRLAVRTFTDHGITHAYGELVDRIACRTEELLLESTDIEEAYLMLHERARNSRPMS